MKNKKTAQSALKILGVPVAMLLMLSVSLAGAKENGVVASATGGYQATYAAGAGGTRNIQFAANRHASNDVKGQLQFKNLDTGTILHYDVTCLRIEGNVATISGIAKTDSQLATDFPYFWLRVADNGPGKQSTDYVSPFVASDVDLPCYDDVFEPTIPINVGNIQVRVR